MVARPDDEVLLDRAALLVAAHARPDVDVDRHCALLDGLARGVAEPTLPGLLATLFGPGGFSGAVSRYHDPDSSYLDSVLARRQGIPISLSIVLLEVGRRVGVPLVGVGMPGHFLVRDQVDPDLFVDPFAGGALRNPEGCRAIFEMLHPGRPFQERYLEPTGRKAILTRVLTNLAAIHRSSGDRKALTWTLELRALLPEPSPLLHHELSGLLTARGRFDEAADQLEMLDDPSARVAAEGLRARLN